MNRKRITITLILALVLSILLPASASAGDYNIQKFGIDSKYYLENENITAFGYLYNGTAPEEGKNITITIFNSTWSNSITTTTLSDGSFSSTISTPSQGSYNITANYETTISNTIGFTVISAAETQRIKAWFTSNTIAIPLTSAHSITSSDLAISNMKGGDKTINGTTYYFLVEKSQGIKFDRLYFDNDADITTNAKDLDGLNSIGNLREGSILKIGTEIYKVFYIDPLGSEVVLFKEVKPPFSNTTGSTPPVTLLILALNATGSPVVNDEITLKIFNDDGSLLLEQNLQPTDEYGLTNYTLSIPSTAGLYHIVFNDRGHISFLVENLDMFGDILSAEYNPKHTFAKGEEIIYAAFLKNRTSGAPISNANVIARVTDPEGISITYPMTYDSKKGLYNYTTNISMNAHCGQYKVEYLATISGQTQRAFTCYDIKGFDLFLMPVAPMKPDSEGFAPGEEGFIVISGINLSSGDVLDLAALTENADKSYFTFKIADDKNNDRTGNWNTMNITQLFDQFNAPQWVRDDVIKKVGTGACVISFATPGENGIYEAKVRVNLSGSLEEARTSISVQNIFLHGEPINANGWFSPFFSPKSNVTLMIMTFDPSSMGELDASKINSAGLIEVWSESANDIVTDRMENVELITVNTMMGVHKALKFTANDSYLGFHHVKFWVNATVNNSYIKAIGNGWYMTKLYNIWAQPESQNGTFMSIGSSPSRINITVYVKDGGFNNVSGATVAIEEIRYTRAWEAVEFDTTNNNNTGTTDSSGSVTISIKPPTTDSDGKFDLKSGMYDIKVKVTATDPISGEQIVDYGHGWFDVKGFMFFARPSNWDVGLNKPVNFILAAYNPDFSPVSANVTLTKIISHGSWDMMKPPTIYNDTDVEVGIIAGEQNWTYPNGIDKSGNFEFVFEARSQSGIEVSSAWIQINAFVANAYGENWQREYAVDGEVSIIVEAKYSWTDPAPISIDSVNITKVMREGMWMMPYKNGTEMDKITTISNTPDGRKRITFNTTGWDQGGYFMDIKVTRIVNNQPQEVYTGFWFRLANAKVTVTELYRINVNGAKYYTNTTTINVTMNLANVSWDFNKGSVSQGLIGGYQFGSPIQPISTFENEFLQSQPKSQPYKMLAVDTINLTLYIAFDREPMKPANLTPEGCDVYNKSAGDTFTDLDGRIWRIKEIKTDGTVTLEGVNTLANGIMLSPEIMGKSKSGRFLAARFEDAEWLGINLDNESGWSSQFYAALLIDEITENKYNTVLINRTSEQKLIFNREGGIFGYKNATNGTTPVAFGGKPIYLISNMYTSGVYELEFSSYRAGWEGQYLGTFANGTIIKIPFMVTSPDGTTPINNATVIVDGLTWFDTMGIKVPLNVSATTTQGVAIVQLDTSQYAIETGQYLIHYNVTLPNGKYVTVPEDQKWMMPQIEIRNFEVSGATGIMSRLTLTKIRNGVHMIVGDGQEIEYFIGVHAWRMPSPDEHMYRFDRPFEFWFYNSTDGQFYYSKDKEHFVGPYAMVNRTEANADIKYNLTAKYPSGHNITLQGIGDEKTFAQMWVLRLQHADNASNTIRINASYMGSPWTWQTRPEQGEPGGRPFEFMPFSNGTMAWFEGGLNIRAREVYVNSSDPSDCRITLALDHENDEPSANNSFTPNGYLFVGYADATAQLSNGIPSDGEFAHPLHKYRGPAAAVNISGNRYNIYGYEDIVNTTLQEEPGRMGWIPTMDRVLVEEANTGAVIGVYRIGEVIPELNNYYVALASKWGGKIILIDSNVTRIYPLNDWAPDGDVYYVGTFTEAQIKVNLSNERDNYQGQPNSTKQYYILLYDDRANGVNFPSAAVYDDDPDLTEVQQQFGIFWGAFDMYGEEGGYGDYVGGWEEQKNMSEKRVWEIGEGDTHMQPLSIPKVSVKPTHANVTIFKEDWMFAKGRNFTIYVTANAFDGTPIQGTVNLDKLILVEGGSKDTGPIPGLPKTYTLNATTAMIDGDALLQINSSQINDPEGILASIDFAKFVAKMRITDGTGASETLEISFGMYNPEMEIGPGPGPGSGPKP
jgi:hypothetical protein